MINYDYKIFVLFTKPFPKEYNLCTWGCCCWGAGGALASIWGMKGTAPICWGRKGWPIICICPGRGWKAHSYTFWCEMSLPMLFHIACQRVNHRELSNAPGHVSGGLTEGTSSVAAYLVAHFCVKKRMKLIISHQAYTLLLLKDKSYVKLWRYYFLHDYSFWGQVLQLTEEWQRPHHLSHLQQALAHHHSQNDQGVSKHRSTNNTLQSAILISRP